MYVRRGFFSDHLITFSTLNVSFIVLKSYVYVFFYINKLTNIIKTNFSSPDRSCSKSMDSFINKLKTNLISPDCSCSKSNDFFIVNTTSIMSFIVTKYVFSHINKSNHKINSRNCCLDHPCSEPRKFFETNINEAGELEAGTFWLSSGATGRLATHWAVSVAETLLFNSFKTCFTSPRTGMWASLFLFSSEPSMST